MLTNILKVPEFNNSIMLNISEFGCVAGRAGEHAAPLGREPAGRALGVRAGPGGARRPGGGAQPRGGAAGGPGALGAAHAAAGPDAGGLLGRTRPRQRRATAVAVPGSGARTRNGDARHTRGRRVSRLSQPHAYPPKAAHRQRRGRRRRNRGGPRRVHGGGELGVRRDAGALVHGVGAQPQQLSQS